MPVELEFWAENLNRNNLRKSDISDYSVQKHHHNKANPYSIFESK